jgi:hypothetical protein
MRRIAGGIGMVAAASALALPSSAAAAVTCAVANNVIQVTIGSADFPTLSVDPSTGHVAVSGCGDLPGPGQVARIDVTEPGIQDGQIAIDASTPFAPGIGDAEGGGQPELEINVDLGGGNDFVSFSMGNGNDNARLGTLRGGSSGINLNAGAEPIDPDGDDVRLSGVESLSVSAGSGTDSNVIDARGGPEFVGPLAIGLGASGAAGSDQLSAGVLGSNLSGGAGNDTLRSGPGSDTLRGGPGRDTLTYDGATAGVTINLSTATPQNTGGAGIDTLDHAGDSRPDFEDLVGSAFDDNLTGTSAANTIVGGAGVDTIFALAGNDNVRVDDGVGGDRADCGSGTDNATADALGATPLDVLIACETRTFVDRTQPPAASGGSGTPGGATSMISTPTKDTIPPTLRSLRLSPTRFQAARSGSGLRAAVATGTRMTFALSERATVAFRVERRRGGRRVRGRCRAPTAANRRAPRCRRYVLRPGRLSWAGRAGANAVRFMGRLSERRLPRGRYRLVLTATDPAGNRSAARRIGFTIV